MDLGSAKAIVLILSENFSFYPPQTQRSALEGIFQLADECKEEVGREVSDVQCDGIQTSLSLVKMLLSESLKRGNLDEGFRAAHECFWPLSENLSSCALAVDGLTNPGRVEWAGNSNEI